METIHEWILDIVNEVTSPDSVWTSKQRLIDEGRKEGYLSDDVANAIEDLDEDQEIIYWHGLIAPADTESVQAVIDEEVNRREFTRKLLIGKANRVQQS